MTRPSLPPFACAAALLALAPLAAAAKAPRSEICAFHLDCQLGERRFALELKSASGECVEDDMRASLVRDGHSTPLALRPAWYFFSLHLATALTPACTSQPDARGRRGEPFSAYAVGADRLVLFFKASGRPGLDRVVAVLFDAAAGKVLDQRDLGETRSQHVVVLPHERGFRLRIVRPSLSLAHQLACDCIEAVLDDWLLLSWDGDRLASAWQAP